MEAVVAAVFLFEPNVLQILIQEMKYLFLI